MTDQEFVLSKCEWAECRLSEEQFYLGSWTVEAVWPVMRTPAPLHEHSRIMIAYGPKDQVWKLARMAVEESEHKGHLVAHIASTNPDNEPIPLETLTPWPLVLLDSGGEITGKTQGVDE